MYAPSGKGKVASEYVKDADLLEKENVKKLHRNRQLAVEARAAPRIDSALCKTLNITHPVILAGMAVVSSPPLAAAVSNAGGLGVIGAGFPNPSPKLLRRMIKELKELLDDPTCFGVDLLIPSTGDNARKTNYDYTKGALPEMIDIICESGCRLFVCAVGVPPTWMVEKLHVAGILVMNMVGAPKHVPKALKQGVDLICAQGTEAGGHTGDITTMVLLPACVRLCEGKISPLTGEPVHVVAAGGMYNGATLAAAFALGCEGVWVGTRLLASEEATATKIHKKFVLEAKSGDTMRSEVFTGRPARVYKTPYVRNWHTERSDEIKQLIKQGAIPLLHDFEKETGQGNPWSPVKTNGYAFGQSAGEINEILPAAVIIKHMVTDAHRIMTTMGARTAKL